MKKLVEYIAESLNPIFESRFSNDDYEHRGDYKYVKRLINYLVNPKDDENLEVFYIKTDDNAPNADNSFILTPDDFDTKKLTEIQGKLGNKEYTYSQFCKDFDSACITTKISKRKTVWRCIWKQPFSGMKVVTRDQEVATCLLFNQLVSENKFTEFDPKNKETLAIIKSIITTVTNNFDNEWARSYIHQMNSLFKYMKGQKIENFRMERYNGDKAYDDWEVSKVYGSLINSYTKTIGGEKDNWDPTDAILYDNTQKEKILTILKNCQALVPQLNDENGLYNFRNEFNKLYEGFFFRGVSLKKLSKVGVLEEFNITGKSNIEIGNLDLQDFNGKPYYEQDRTAYVIFKAKLHLNSSDTIVPEITNDENPDESNPVIENNDEKRFKLCIRTNGKSIACDLSLCKGNSNSTGPSLGKCSVVVWRKCLGFDRNEALKQNRIADVKARFIEAITGNNAKDIILEMASSAIKCGPNCLPFILIH